MGNVKIPGIGPVDSKYVMIGGAAVAGIVGYAYWAKSRSNATEITDYTTDESTEPNYAHDGDAAEYENPGGSQPPIEEDYVSAPTNNIEWGQKAGSILRDIGYEPIAVGVAIGKYLSRMQLSVMEGEMIRAAQGQLGPPPQGTYPINTSPNPAPAPTMKQVTGVRVTNVYRDKVRLEWTRTPGAVGWLVYRKGQESATEHALAPAAYASSLKPNTNYSFAVVAVGPTGKKGPRSTYVNVKTKK